MRPTRAQVDDQIFLFQRRGGVSRYFTELMRAFRRDPAHGVDLVAPPRWSANDYLVEGGLARRLPRGLTHPAVSHLANRWPRGRGLDIVHQTYYHPLYLDRVPRRALRVVSVFDMIPELYPELFPSHNPHRAKQEYVRRADLVLCISESTARDMVELYGAPAARVVVTPLGVDAQFFQPRPAPPAALPSSYVLFVGKREGYKDFRVLAEAFAESSLPPDTELVSVGGEPLGEDTRTLVKRLGLSKRFRHVASLTDQEMADAYAHALCFVFPSRYEGFGLPTLEAMAAGAPTVLADASSHPEVGGSAARYFPAGDTGALTGLLDEIAHSPDLRQRMTADGRTRAARFTWTNTAELTARTYSETLGRA